MELRDFNVDASSPESTLNLLCSWRTFKDYNTLNSTASFKFWDQKLMGSKLLTLRNTSKNLLYNSFSLCVAYIYVKILLHFLVDIVCVERTLNENFLLRFSFLQSF